MTLQKTQVALLVVTGIAAVVCGGSAFYYGAPLPEVPVISEITPSPSDVFADADPSAIRCAYTRPDSAATVIPVAWATAPTPIAVPDLLSTASSTFESGESIGNWKQEYTSLTRAFRVGSISEGKYAGGSVVLILFPYIPVWDGPGFDKEGIIYRFVQVGDTFTLIGRDSDFVLSEWDGPSGANPNLDCSRFSLDLDSTLQGVHLPETVASRGTTLALKSGNLNLMYLPQSPQQTLDNYAFLPVYAGSLQHLYNDPVLGAVYTDVVGSDVGYLASFAEGHIGVGYSRLQQGLYVTAGDGTIRVYDTALPSWYNEDTRVPQVTWTDGSRATSEYTPSDWGGCGATNFKSVMRTLDGKITQSGTTADGQVVYELTDKNHPFLATLYKQYQAQKKAEAEYADSNAQAAAPMQTYEQFVAAHQIFFWRDTLGRLIKFQTSDYRVAECGKPVIYLYPTKTTKVSVQVEPTGGMTISDPAYNGGWTVNATPEGLLTDLATGLTHTYLFWEGNSKEIYDMPERGWVVKEAEVPSFLTEKLSQLGMNEREIADFNEFWVPRMTGSPYFFVTFEGNRRMDQIAPLTVHPKPDTVIRILMDYRPLPAPISVKGFDIKTPERRGFTVVEWGGVLR